jgi:TolA-binding protein
VISFSVPEFENLALSNNNLIMKMLKVFSNQMRRTHRQVASLMKDEKSQNPEVGLFSTGEYYLKNKRYAYAKHIFNHYLIYYPNGKFAAKVTANLGIIETYIAKYGDGSAKNPFDEDDLELQEEGSDISKQYSDALDLILQGKYMNACQALKVIADENDIDFTPKSMFEIGHCMFLMEKYEECILYYMRMISQYPEHPSLVEVLFFMGQSHEKCGRKDQSASFYKKALSLIDDKNGAVYQKIKHALKVLEAM